MTTHQRRTLLDSQGSFENYPGKYRWLEYKKIKIVQIPISPIFRASRFNYGAFCSQFGAIINKMKNVVICGSMKVKDQILDVAAQLKKLKYKPLLPIECMNGEPKVVASRAHMDRIVDKNNTYILIVNAKNGGINNYIGPNSFAEIAFGFYYKKKVFVLNDIYEPYRDELDGWGVVALHGDLEKMDG